MHVPFRFAEAKSLHLNTRLKLAHESILTFASFAERSKSIYSPSTTDSLKSQAGDDMRNVNGFIGGPKIR